MQRAIPVGLVWFALQTRLFHNQFPFKRKNLGLDPIVFVYGLVAPGMFVYTPVTAGAACKLKAGLAQLKMIFPAERCATNGIGLKLLVPPKTEAKLKPTRRSSTSTVAPTLVSWRNP